MARLVNKQFNSPIGLYSQQNIQDVLERETQILANGAVGIDFKNPTVGKPDNLKNSAVLRMLEDEENRQRNGYGPGVKRVAWPPPHETGQGSPYIEENSVQPQGGPHYPSQPAGYQQNNYPQSVQSNAPYQQQRAPLKLDVSQSGSSPLASPLSNQNPQGYRPATPSKGWAPVHSPVTTPSQPSWRQSSPQAGYQPLQSPVASSNQPAWRQNSPTKFQAAHQPVSQQTFLGQQYSGSPQGYSPQTQPIQHYQSPGQQYQPPAQQYQSPGQQYQSPSQQYQSAAQQYNSPGQQYNSSGQQQQYSYSQQYQSSEQVYQSSQPQYQSSQGQYQVPQSPQVQSAPPQVQRQASKPVEPPPSTITLRPQAPMSQAPPPVYTSQPATATLKGGKHLRGDLKWPPEEVKVQAEEENRLRLELARGPVCRPRLVKKDYTDFFEQHALNSTYPGYKIPPGTQFFRPN